MTPMQTVLWVAMQVLTSLLHNWPFLLLGIISAAALKVYVGTERIATLFRRRTGLAVVGSVAAAVATPFCSCGTTAIVLSMLASAVPWAPIVAFMVASPLTSPDELFLSAGLFGWPFALLYFTGSIVLGLAGGGAALIAERSGLLKGQARFEPACPDTGCERLEVTRLAPSLGPGAAAVAEFGISAGSWRLRELGREALVLGRRMLVMFVGFAAIGYAAIAIVPTAWMTALLGGSSPLSIVLAATLGVPFYLSTEASLPLVSSLMQGGMGSGPAMAFLVTGAGTSVGAISGGLLIARWRVLAIVVGVLWIGAIALGLVATLVL